MKRATPQLLLIDVGNSRIKWALAGQKRPIRINGEIATADASSAWLRGFAQKHRKHRVVMACVVPKLTTIFRRAFGLDLAVVDSAMLDGFPMEFGFDYPNPAELGADRVAAAVAVHGQNLHPAIVISCGTATAFSAVNAKGRFCGGAIAPGLQAQLDALLGSTAQLPLTDLRPPRRFLAKSTRDAIRVGVLVGYRGSVREVLHELLETFPKRPRPNIILTGGNASLLAKELGPRLLLRPLLVFEGLLIIGTRLGLPAPKQ